MSHNSNSDHPMKKRLSTPPAGPASSCFRCYRDGTVADDQRRAHEAEKLNGIRFHCKHCDHDWTTDRREAIQHGAFLRRIDVNRGTET